MTSRAVHSTLESLETRRLFATTPAGSLDPSFSTDGYDEAFNGGFATSVATQGEKIVAVGLSDAGSFVAVRYNADGSLDSSFDNDGIRELTDVAVNPGLENHYEPTVVAKADGSMFIVGTSDTGQLFVISLNNDGSLNGGFDDDGLYTTLSTANVAGGAMSGASLYVAGSTGGTAFISRFNSSGVEQIAPGDVEGLHLLDADHSNTVVSFDASADGGTMAVATTDSLILLNGAGVELGAPVSLVTDAYAVDLYDVAVHSNGDVYATGIAQALAEGPNQFQTGLGVWRYTTNALAPSFGDDGVAVNFGIVQGTGIEVDSNGIVVTGISGGGATVARYGFDGELDGAFGDGGVTTSPELGSGAIAFDVALSPTAIAVVGVSDTSFLTARYLSFDVTGGEPSPVRYEDGQLIIEGTDGANTVVVTASGSSVSVTLDMVSYGSFTLNLTDIINITTGGGADNISLASSVTFATSISSGAGNDTIQGGAGADNIDAGDDNDVVGGGSGDDYISGGAGLDIIGGQNGNDIVLGGGGSDALSGGNGRDVLVGGASIDVITGDAAEDIIIGGSTTLSEAQLKQVSAVWNSALTYAQRVATLTSGLLSSGNLLDDGVIDLLAGGNGNDWFLANNDGGLLSNDLIIDRVKAETVTDTD
jgi:uncharacterized delta-60 repeat protein